MDCRDGALDQELREGCAKVDFGNHAKVVDQNGKKAQKFLWERVCQHPKNSHKKNIQSKNEGWKHTGFGADETLYGRLKGLLVWDPK